MFMAVPLMIYEQHTGVGQSFDDLSPSELAIMCSTGILGYLAQLLKTIALQLSHGLGVVIIR